MLSLAFSRVEITYCLNEPTLIQSLYVLLPLVDAILISKLHDRALEDVIKIHGILLQHGNVE